MNTLFKWVISTSKHITKTRGRQTSAQFNHRYGCGTCGTCSLQNEHAEHAVRPMPHGRQKRCVPYNVRMKRDSTEDTMSDIVATNAGKRPVFVDPSTNTLFTTNPATGEFAQIIDQATGKAMTKRPLFVDPDTGHYCAIDMKSGQVAPVIDPVTGKPMASEPPAGSNPETDGTEPELDEEALALADASAGGTAAEYEDKPDYDMNPNDLASVLDSPASAQEHEKELTSGSDSLDELAPDPEPRQEPLPDPEPLQEPAPEPLDVFAPDPEPQQEPKPDSTDVAAKTPDLSSLPTPASESCERPSIPNGVLAPEAIAQMQAEVAALRAQLDAQARMHTSGAAVAALVLGVLAMLTSLIPVVNYASVALAFVVLILAFVSLSGINKGKTRGKGMATAGVILAIVAVVIVIATQFFYGPLVTNAIHNLRFDPNPFATIIQSLLG